MSHKQRRRVRLLGNGLLKDTFTLEARMLQPLNRSSKEE